MKARERRVLALVRFYQRWMGLGNWDLKVRFSDKGCGEKEEAGAACTASDEYLQATLYFDLDRIPAGEEPDFIRHELAHCLTWELLRVAEHLAGEDKNAQEMVRAASERCTTLVERMPIWRKT